MVFSRLIMSTRNYFILLFMTFHFVALLAQEGFQVNGVQNNFKPTFAFTNAYIVVSPEKVIEKGTLIIKGDRIISVDTTTLIPKDAIIIDLNGDYIYPSFIDLYSNYGLPKIEKKNNNYYSPQYESNKKGE